MKTINRSMVATALAVGMFATAVPSAVAADQPVATGFLDGLTRADVENLKTECEGNSGVTFVMDPSQAVAGVEFTLRRISDIDLNTMTGWRTVGELTTGEAKHRPMDRRIWEGTTNAQGKVSFTDLPVGVFYVTAQAPEGAELNRKDFVITVPTGKPDSSGESFAGWDCDRTMAPKFSLRVINTPPSTPDYPPTDPDTPPTTSTPREPEKTPTPPAPPTTPTELGEPTPPEQPQNPGGNLARTGAAVLGVLMAAAILIGFGLMLLGWRRKKDEG